MPENNKESNIQEIKDFDFEAFMSGSKSKRKGMRYQPMNMIDMKGRKVPQWLFRDLCFRESIGVMHAPPESFKSFIGVDLCSRLAHGLIWNGRELKAGRVIYVAGEGFPMFYNRRLAWFKHNDIDEPEIDNFQVIEGAVDLMDVDSVDTFIADILWTIEQGADPIDLTVFDTLSTCTAGQDEGASGVMTLAIEHAKKIRNALGCTVLLIHHPGKDVSRGSRGHSSLKGNIDFEWTIERNDYDPDCILKVTKQKDGESGKKFFFIATKIMLGVYDDEGVEQSSLALTPCHPANNSANVKAQAASDRIETDLQNIVDEMNPPEEVTVHQLALRMKALLGSNKTAAERINNAVPLAWATMLRHGNKVSIRRMVGVGLKGATVVVMKPLND